MTIHRSVRSSLGAIFLFTLTALPNLALGQASAANDRQESTSDGGIARASILKWLDGKKKDRNRFNEFTLINRIAKYGLSFKPTEEDLEAFRKNGGSEKLITVVQNARKQPEREPPPPPPPPLPLPKEGHLTVGCQPAECNVSVNASPFLPTKDGVLPQTLPEGLATVTVNKEDYEPDQKQQVADVKENKPARLDFKFKVSNAALERVGGRLFRQMIDALGGPAGLKASGVIRGAGTLKSYADGKITEWDLATFIELPANGYFILSGRGQKYEVSRTDSGFVWKPQGAEVRELEDCLRWIQDFQIANTVGRLQGTSFKMVADQLVPAEGHPVVIRATNGSETYKIALDPDFRPSEITLESTGLDSGLRILYTDYTKLGSSYYPRHAQVILPDASRHGVVVQFGQFELNFPAVAGGGRKNLGIFGGKKGAK